MSSQPSSLPGESVWWKIPFTGNLSYGQCIALRMNINRYQGRKEGDPTLGILLKQGDYDGFYIQSTREFVKRVAEVMNERALDWWGKQLEFSPFQISAGADEKYYDQEEVDEIIASLEETLTGQIGTQYAHANQALSDKLTGLETELAETSAALDAEKKNIKVPAPAELCSLYVEQMLQQVQDVASIYNLIATGLNNGNYTLEQLALASLPEDTFLRHEFPNVSDIAGVLARKIPVFDESGTAPFSAGTYQQSAQQLKELELVVSHAPAGVRELVAQNLQQNIDTLKEQTGDYETKKQAYDTKAGRLRELQDAITAKKATYRRAREAVGSSVRESLETVQGQPVYVALCRQSDTSLALFAARAPDGAAGAPFNNDLSLFLTSLVQNAGYSGNTDQLDGRYHLTIRCDDASAAQHALYAGILKEWENTRFAGLGIPVEPLIVK